MTEENNQSNPGLSGSSDDFFDEMERQVNGAIQDEDQPVGQKTLPDSDPSMETRNISEGSDISNSVDWEKRYKDSSREATRMAGQLNQLKPFVPLLKAMKQDSGLVGTVKDYLSNGGKPSKNIKEQLNLPKDFVFDQEEAFDQPDSDSAKLLNSHVDGLVSKRVGQMMEGERQRTTATQVRANRAKEAAEFVKRHNMSKEEFGEMMNAAKQKNMTLDDIYYLVNKDKANANVAKSTKADMVNQMKNVRSIPTTASGVNSPRSEKSPDDQIFDDLVDSGGGMEELFG
tara:strand:- start:101 stop:958 length:858 start_codon:yes stop_codon:yes gene_type:complete